MAGLTDRYVSKLLCPHPLKGIGRISWNVLGALGLTVVFSSSTVPSVNNQQTTVLEDGRFWITKTLAEGESGTVAAVVTDWWGLQSVEVWAEV